MDYTLTEFTLRLRLRKAWFRVRYPGILRGRRRALYKAVIGRDRQRIEKLLRSGIDANVQQVYGVPLLNRAIVSGYDEIVRMLVEAGADVNARSPITLHTPLMIACQWGRQEIVRYLLERGADVNARALSRATALVHAAMYDYPEVVRILLDAGAERNVVFYGDTALTVAESKGFDRVVDLLKHYPAG